MTAAMITIEAGEVQSQNILGGSLVERFLVFAGVAEKSALTYRKSLKQLAKFFAAENITVPTRADLENFRDNLIAEGKSPATVHLYLTSAKVFFRWTAQEGIFPNIADHLKARVKISHEHKKDALTPAQARKLVNAVGKGEPKKRRSKAADSLKSKRDRAIIALMATAGLRTIEVIRADVGDLISQYGKTFLLVQGKGHSAKDARVLVASQVVSLIREYLQARGDVDDVTDPLFTSTANRNRNARLQTQTISKLVKANLRGIGLDSPRLTAHSLRHTAATTQLLAGADISQVQQCLRHVNINTTMIYNNAVERMKNQVEQTAADSIFGGVA